MAPFLYQLGVDIHEGLRQLGGPDVTDHNRRSLVPGGLLAFFERVENGLLIA